MKMTTGTPSGKKWSKLRRFVRYRTDIRVVVTTRQNGKSVPIYGRCSVIAEGGFGATLAGELPVGERVEAELILVGGNRASVKVPALVRFRSGFRHGFEFAGVSPGQRVQLRDFCAILQPAD